MGKNFAELFRRSKFAQFDPKIPRVYIASHDPPCPVKTASSDLPTNRPAFFGFKRDLPPRHYGRPLSKVIMESLDGNYGLPTLQNAEFKLKAYELVQQLQRLLGKGGNPHCDVQWCDYTNRPNVAIMRGEGGIRVAGRLLNKLYEGGYAVGLGGVVAELPSSEVPLMRHFSEKELKEKRVYYFYVKAASIRPDGRPLIQLSMKSQY